MANGSDRVYVSLDTLRTEIRAANGELELSLRKFVGQEMDKKAPLEAMLLLSGQLTELSRLAVTKDGPLMSALENVLSEWEGFARGELRPAMRGAIEEVVESVAQTGADNRWTKRERWIAVSAGIFWFICTIVAVAGFFHP